MSFPGRCRGLFALALAASWTAFGMTRARAAPTAPQVNASEQVREVVATLATGQLTVIAARDGLIIATIGNSYEPKSLPPMIVPLGEASAAVVLGADEWILPPAGHTLLRLDRKLPGLVRGGMGPTAPSLHPGAGVSHLEQLGMAVLEPLRAAAASLHSRIHMPPDLPLTEIVLIRQSEAEPLEVWDLSYWIRQTFWQENFWSTEVQRPRSMQLYPTKGDKSRMVQIAYPPASSSPGLSAWLAQPTGRFAQAIESDPRLTAVRKKIAAGKLKKIKLAELVPLVKTALETMTPAGTVNGLATLDPQNGFIWIIRPRVSKTPVKRPSGAPSLENPPSLR